MSYKTDLGRVIGLGSAKEGTADWWKSRMSSVALIPLTLLFLCLVIPLIGESHETVIAALQRPFTAIVAILFLGVGFAHLASGLHEILVDYVHGKATLAISLVIIKLACWGIGFVGIFAVAKIAFGG